MLKFLFLTHRYLGIGLGLMMLLWCLSGFVMMYKPYPELNQKQQLETLTTLNLNACCSSINDLELLDEEYQRFHLMMLKGTPVLHLYSIDGQFRLFDLKNGKFLQGIAEIDAKDIAQQYANQHGYASPFLNGAIQKDQWSVYSSYNKHRPLYHFSVNDSAGTQWYISSRSGEIVQITTREQRIWGYLGAVIHWIYPTILREKAQLWSQTVIWLSVLGTCLTLTGLYFGVKQYKVRKDGSHSPYRGLSLWHHYAGLLFGLLTFTWVLSGLFSMQPWGLFEGSGASSEARALRGSSITLEEINDSLAQLNDFDSEGKIVLLEGKKLQDELFLISMDADLNKKRYRAKNFNIAPLSENNLQTLATLMLSNDGVKKSEMLYVEDNYYFSHHNEVSLPVYKVIADNTEQTLYYLSPLDGDILSKVDSASKGFRWFHYGLHRLDFGSLIRSRPLWDIMMWFLLSGVTLGILTGFLMGIKRVLRRSRS